MPDSETPDPETPDPDSARPEARLNPYAPSAIAEDAGEARRLAQNLRRDDGAEDEAAAPNLRRTFLRWFVVCGISAIPSFVFGLIVTGNQFAGMIVGILMFVAGYTWLDFATAHRPWRRNPRIRRTLRIAYGTRIAISVLFPIGGFLDVICGTLSMAITTPLTGVVSPGEQSLGFFGAVLTTLVQGCLLNVVLGIYALLVHAIQLAIAAMRGSRHQEASSL